MHSLLMAAAAFSALANPGSGPDLRIVDRIAWETGEAVRVQTRASVFPTGAKSGAVLTARPGGRLAVAWESRRQNEGLPAVVLREFDRLGRPLGEETRLAGAVEAQSRPALSGGLSVYEVSGRDGSMAGVFVGGRAIHATRTGDQADPVLASLPGGRAVAAWACAKSGTSRRIVARVLDREGRPAGPEIEVSRGDAYVPTVAAHAGGALVAWQTRDGLFARRLTPAGEPTGGIVRLAGAGAMEPVLARAGNGWALGFVAGRADGRHQAMLQRLDDRLRPLGGPIRVAEQDGIQNAVSVAGRADGRIAVAWNLSDGRETDVFLRTFDAAGRPVAEPTLAHREAAGNQTLAEANGRHRIAYGDDGAVSVAWNGDGALGDPSGVHLTRLIPTRRLRPADLASLDAAEASTRVALATPPPAPALGNGSEIQMIAEPMIPPVFDPRGATPDPGVRTMSNNGFLAISQTPWTPPDPHLAVGPNHIGVVTNGAIAFFTKSGQLTFRDEIENTFGFWGSLGATNFVFDPEIMFDPLSRRWFAMASERANPPGSFFLVAVSDDEDPNGDWFKYRINVSGLAGNDIDSPNIATDRDAVYLTADFFSVGQRYLVYMIRKADLLVGSQNPLTRNFLITGTQSHGLPITWDANAPAQYMIEHFEASNNTTVRLHAITDPLGNPQRATFTLPVPAYSPPENIPSGGTTARVTSFDSRFWSCVYRNGSLWATHHVNSTRIRARWYEIRMNGWPTSGQNPTLAQSGEIDPGGTVRTSFSSIAVDGAGNAAVVSARSSPTDFFSMFVATRRASDPLGTMPNQRIVKDSTSAYNVTRWGDYSGVVVDPADDRTFWGHHEWAEGGGWRTWVQGFSAVTERRIAAASFTVVRGSLLSGDLASLAASDDVRLVVRNGAVALPAEAPITVLYEATSLTASPSALTFRHENRVSIAGLTQRVDLFDFAAGVWGESDVRAGATSDATVTINATNPARYVQAGSRLMRSRLEVRPAGPLFTNTWNAGVDFVEWTVGE